MLRNVLLDLRVRAYASDKQAAALLDAIENVPDLLTRWPQCNQSWIVGALQDYERKFGVSSKRYSDVLLHGLEPKTHEPSA